MRAKTDKQIEFTPDSPIKDFFKRWKIEAGYISILHEAGTAKDEDGKEIEVLSGHGMGSLNVHFRPTWRKDRLILDFDRLLPVVYAMLEAIDEAAPLEDDEYRKGAKTKKVVSA